MEKAAADNRPLMIAQLGADMNVLHLAREMIDCGERNDLSKHCRATAIR